MANVDTTFVVTTGSKIKERSAFSFSEILLRSKVASALAMVTFASPAHRCRTYRLSVSSLLLHSYSTRLSSSSHRLGTLS